MADGAAGARPRSCARLNESGALNGHVPVTAIVTAAALLCAQLNGYDTVAMANERSASAGNLRWDGVEVNHQFSKSLRVERLLDGALEELRRARRAPSRSCAPRPSSRSHAPSPALTAYHRAFTSCNTIFRLDPALRGASWCCECPKCRFVFLALAPFTTPEQLREIFGRDLLDEEHQFEGFALLCAAGGPQAVRVRGGGAGEPRRDPAAGRRASAGAGTGCCGGCRGGPSPARPPGGRPGRGCSS